MEGGGARGYMAPHCTQPGTGTKAATATGARCEEEGKDGGEEQVAEQRGGESNGQRSREGAADARAAQGAG